MHCHAFEIQLNERLDDRQDPLRDSLLVAHAQSCSPCRALLEGSVALVGTMSRASLSPKHSLAASIVAKVISEEATAQEPGYLTTSMIRGDWANSSVDIAMDAELVDSLPGESTPASGAFYSGNSHAVEPSRSAWNQQRKSSSTRWWLLAASTAAIALLMITAGVIAIASRGNGRFEARERHLNQPNGLAMGAMGTRRTEPMHGSGLQFSYHRYRGAFRDLADQLPVAAQQLDQLQSQTPGIETLRATLFVALDTLLRSMQGLPSEQHSQPGSVFQHPAEPSPITSTLATRYWS